MSGDWLPKPVAYNAERLPMPRLWELRKLLHPEVDWALYTGSGLQLQNELDRLTLEIGARPARALLSGWHEARAYLQDRGLVHIAYRHPRIAGPPVLFTAWRPLIGLLAQRGWHQYKKPPIALRVWPHAIPECAQGAWWDKQRLAQLQKFVGAV